MPKLDLIATCAFGLEAVVKRELAEFGWEAATLQPGRLLFHGDFAAVAKSNVCLRTAERILLRIATIPAADFDQLFEFTRELPWHEWIPADGEFPVRGRSHKSALTSIPAVQRSVKKAIVESLQRGHAVNLLPETGPLYHVEVSLDQDVAMLTIDTTGEGLHKRGYRPQSGAAPLRETLAAGLVLLSVWQPERPLWDPFCGTGTIAIEAAMIGRRLAPGRHRAFAVESWPQCPAEVWRDVREEVDAEALARLPEPILATDQDSAAVSWARKNAAAAGVEQDLHIQQREFHDVHSKRDYGCIICNPPYGHRIGEAAQVALLHREMPLVLRRLKTWSHFILTSFDNFETVIGQRATRRRKLFNGRIECQFYQFLGPKPPTLRQGPRADAGATAQHASRDAPPQQAIIPPVFGGLKESSTRQAAELASRIKKRARHLRRWPERGVHCYRLYECDIPEIPLVVDRYNDCLHISDASQPKGRTPAEHADWLDLMVKSIGASLDVTPDKVFLKRRQRQRGSAQYERLAQRGAELVVTEGGLKFVVNLSDYLDTGLFLDHRLTRALVRRHAEGTRFLNLFGYTGSFTVYAAAGGAQTTTTVDSSRTYLDWAERNLGLNEFHGDQHRLIRRDALEYLTSLPAQALFDLVVIDPPTFSNSKSLEQDWDIQRDHAETLRQVARRLAVGGTIYFSSNSRRFKLAAELAEQFQIREISKQTVPEDFRNRRVHRCWRIILAS